MHFVNFYDSDRKQEVSIPCSRIVKVSVNPKPETFDRFRTYINTDDGGTVRIAETKEVAVGMIKAACTTH